MKWRNDEKSGHLTWSPERWWRGSESPRSTGTMPFGAHGSLPDGLF